MEPKKFRLCPYCTACPPRLKRFGRRQAMAGLGHEDAFPRPTLSARCRFSQGTFAGMRGKGRDAPKAAVCRSPGTRLFAIESGP